MPTTAFTQTEIEAVRRIVRMGTSSSEQSEITDKLSALNDAQAASVRADLVSYARVSNGTVRVKGGIKGQDFSLERERLHFTNTIRMLLNYSPIAEATDPDDISMGLFRLGTFPSTCSSETDY